MSGRLIRLVRLPLRLRVTLASVLSMAVILVTLSLFVYVRLHAELVRALDTGLQARASAIAAGMGQLGPTISDGPDAPLVTMTQIRTPTGRIIARAGAPVPRMPALAWRELTGPVFIQIPGRNRAPAVRLYVLPVNEGRRLFIVAGATLANLDQTLGRLGLLLLAGDPAGLALAGLAAWFLTGAALRPVERMRREAAAISVSDPARRLQVPETNDEVARLGETLNSLLDRLQHALDRERRLLDDASHELRTPLSTLKAEIDLALSRARTAAELKAALQSASEETNRLTRLAQDLLVLSRARGGGLRIHLVSTALGELLDRVCARHRPRAAQAGLGVDCHVPPIEIQADPMRLGQALDNLLDNAISYSGDGGLIRVRAEVADGIVTITIENSGPGFPAGILPRAFEPFVSGSHPALAQRDRDGRSMPVQPGAGLGLAIVQAVAQAHDGRADASNVPGGARVTMTLVCSPLGPASR